MGDENPKLPGSVVDVGVDGPLMSLEGSVFVVTFTKGDQRCIAVGFSAAEAVRKAELLIDDLK